MMHGLKVVRFEHDGYSGFRAIKPLSGEPVRLGTSDWVPVNVALEIARQRDGLREAVEIALDAIDRKIVSHTTVRHLRQALAACGDDDPAAAGRGEGSKQ